MIIISVDLGQGLLTTSKIGLNSSWVVSISLFTATNLLAPCTNVVSGPQAGQRWRVSGGLWATSNCYLHRFPLQGLCPQVWATLLSDWHLASMSPGPHWAVECPHKPPKDKRLYRTKTGKGQNFKHSMERRFRKTEEASWPSFCRLENLFTQ